ncbi:unnamed protein product, partial [marine sediment metagenome]
DRKRRAQGDSQLYKGGSAPSTFPELKLRLLNQM